MGGAKIRYHVVRQVRYPDWWYWCFAWRMPQQSGSQEIAHGTAETGADGTFKIQFIAKPDLSVAEKDEPVFHYQISADVTDTNGETRSAERTVQAGYTALRAALTANGWLTSGKAIEITLSTTTLDGEPQKAEGALKIYRLKQPEEVVRPDILGQRPAPRVTTSRLSKSRENREIAKPQAATPAPDASDPNTWELGEVVAEQGLTTDAAGRTTWSTKLEAGAYRAVRDPGPLRQEDRGPAAAERPGPRGQAVPHQDSEPRGRAQVVAGAGRRIHGPLGKRLRSGPRVHRDRTPRQAAAKFLDRSRARPNSRSSRP